MSIDELTFTEDAIEAIGQKQTEEQFVGCHKGAIQDEARRIYRIAQQLVYAQGSVRKAQNFTKKCLDKARRDYFPA